MLGRLAAITTAALIATSGGPAEAGEIIFKDGTRLPAELVNRALLVSTGADLVEVQPEQVAALANGEIRTRDGRTIRGALVGGTVRVRTTYGELTVMVDNVVEFRADGPAAAPAPEARPPGPPVPPAERPSPKGPMPPETEPFGRRVWDASMGIARTVTEGVDRVHDGFVAAGRAIRDGLFSVTRAARRTLTD